MSSFQYLNALHVLHFHRKGILSVKVECLCGWMVEGNAFTAESYLTIEAERHIRYVRGLEASVKDIR